MKSAAPAARSGCTSFCAAAGSELGCRCAAGRYGADRRGIGGASSVRIISVQRCAAVRCQAFTDSRIGRHRYDVTRNIASAHITNFENSLKHPAFVVRLLSATAVTAVVIGAYLLMARPFQLRWGATDAEVARAMPGDALSHRPTFLSTRAITIDAAPEVIWPWLVQLGYGRAGFYGYDILENLGSPRGLKSADHIVPELQRLAVGDPLPLSAAGGLVVNAIAPNQYLVWSGTSGTYPGAFTWALYPIDASHTRLVSRIQWSHHWSQPLMMGMDLFTEFTDHLAVRKILQGVKDRAEGRVESFARQTFEFAVLVWALFAFFAALWFVFRGRLARPFLIASVAGVAWLIIWYAPISVVFGVVVNVAVVVLVRASRVPSGGSRAAKEPASAIARRAT